MHIYDIVIVAFLNCERELDKILQEVSHINSLILLFICLGKRDSFANEV